MSRDLVVEAIRQAAQRGDGITLDAVEVIDLNQELLRLYNVRAVPQRSAAERFTNALLWDLGKTLERHGFTRAEGPGPMADFASAVVAAARAFEGTAR